MDLNLLFISIAAAVCALGLWYRRTMKRQTISDTALGTPSIATGAGRRENIAEITEDTAHARVQLSIDFHPERGMKPIAHDALLSHGWHYDGESNAHGLPTSSVRTYTHPLLAGHRINVSPVGEWEHTKIPGMPATGSTPEELSRHLGALHGTLSIADLHLPGRRGD